MCTIALNIVRIHLIVHLHQSANHPVSQRTPSRVWLVSASQSNTHIITLFGPENNLDSKGHVSSTSSVRFRNGTTEFSLKTFPETLRKTSFHNYTIVSFVSAFPAIGFVESISMWPSVSRRPVIKLDCCGYRLTCYLPLFSLLRFASSQADRAVSLGHRTRHLISTPDDRTLWSSEMSE